MRVTILGSSGQIGAYLTQYLRDKGHQVTEFDVVNHDSQDMTCSPNVNLNDALQNAQFCLFLGFDVGGAHYLKKYQHTFKFIDNNTRLMANAFQYLDRYKTPFVFASSQMSNMSYSPYGVMKRVGELYTKSLKGLICKFWNVYGIETDLEKAHVITDFIKKGFETGNIDMMTDGTEEREFLYAEDCCEALETLMLEYDKFNSDNELHITSGIGTTILEIGKIIQDIFATEKKTVTITPAQAKDEVQKDARNIPDPFIRDYWNPKTSIKEGIENIYRGMKQYYE